MDVFELRDRVGLMIVAKRAAILQYHKSPELSLHVRETMINALKASIDDLVLIFKDLDRCCKELDPSTELNPYITRLFSEYGE